MLPGVMWSIVVELLKQLARHPALKNDLADIGNICPHGTR